ncbi:MAG: hypothetical protein QM766_16205 [Burkholderiaceae bacterium]
MAASIHDPGRPPGATTPGAARTADAVDGPGGSRPPPAAFGDASIPMLTDVLPAPRPVAVEAPPPPPPDDVRWSELSLHVQHEVLERLIDRSDAMLGAPLRRALDEVLERRLRSLQADLQESLSQWVRDLVSRAVADELARVHGEILRRQREQRPGHDDRA